MEVRSGWVHQRQSGIGFDELSSMVTELMAIFERQNGIQATPNLPWSPDWISPTSRTRVIRHGSSESLHSVLKQTPDTIAAEYEVLYRGTQVFTWRDYLWPKLRQESRELRTGKYYLPKDCLDELMAFHVSHRTPWLKRYQRKLINDRAIEIDKVGVVTQANCIELG